MKCLFAILSIHGHHALNFKGVNCAHVSYKHADFNHEGSASLAGRQDMLSFSTIILVLYN